MDMKMRTVVISIYSHKADRLARSRFLQICTGSAPIPRNDITTLQCDHAEGVLKILLLDDDYRVRNDGTTRLPEDSIVIVDKTSPYAEATTAIARQSGAHVIGVGPGSTRPDQEWIKFIEAHLGIQRVVISLMEEPRKDGVLQKLCNMSPAIAYCAGMLVSQLIVMLTR